MPTFFHLALLTLEATLNICIDFFSGMTEMQVLFQQIQNQPVIHGPSSRSHTLGVTRVTLVASKTSAAQTWALLMIHSCSNQPRRTQKHTFRNSQPTNAPSLCCCSQESDGWDLPCMHTIHLHKHTHTHRETYTQTNISVFSAGSCYSVIACRKHG